MKRYWDRIIALGGVIVLSFFYGVAVMRYEIPPYYLLKQADIARKELWQQFKLESRGEKDSHPHQLKLENRPSRIVTHDNLSTYGDVTFLAMFYGERYGMFLIDQDGEVIHEWKIPDSVLEQLGESISTRLKKDHYMIHGAHLFENGNVAFNIENRGLVMIDQDSNLLWHLDRPTHHSVFVDEERNLWVGSRRMVSDEDDAFPHMKVPYYDEVILRVSVDGTVQEEFAITEAIFRGGYEGMLLQGHSDFPETTQQNVIHLNDVEIVGKDFAQSNAAADAGDVLFSMRTTDSIALLNRKENKVKWSLTGPFLRQHDPDAMADGSIFVFDNRTAKGSFNDMRYRTEPQSFGYSRILQIDPKTQEVLWKYEGTEKSPFYSSVMGKLQVLGNGNVLVVESEGGRVFEIHRESGEIVWEFRNTQPKIDESISVGRVSDATRFHWSELPFLRH